MSKQKGNPLEEFFRKLKKPIIIDENVNPSDNLKKTDN